MSTFLRQGITTLITGNCGFSAAGFAEESSHLEDLGGELFSLDELQRHSSMKQWLAHVDQALPMNIISLLGHGTARLSVAGLHQAELNENQLQRMLEVLDQGLAEGAGGISLGLMYAPGVFAPREELEKVAELCAKHHKPLTIHPRAESAISLSYSSFTKSHLLLALDEILEIQQKTGCPIVYSHLIFVGRRTWKDVDQALGSIEKAHEEGYQIGFDMYPYDFGASVITVVLPPWYQQLSPKERLRTEAT